jgi:prepilin-type processing-associated H-X9-DG protein
MRLIFSAPSGDSRPVNYQLADIGFSNRGWSALGTEQKDLSILRCPSDGYTRKPDLTVSNYAKSMGNQYMPDRGCPGLNGNDFGTGPANHGDAYGDSTRLSGMFARFYWGGKIADAKDGTSNVIAMGEVKPYCGDHSANSPWTYYNAYWYATVAPINFPTCPGEGLGHSDGDIDCNHLGQWNMSMGFKSNHPGGAHFVFCDGSVHFLPETIDYMTYQRLGDRRDGQPVGNWGF